MAIMKKFTRRAFSGGLLASLTLVSVVADRAAAADAPTDVRAIAKSGLYLRPMVDSYRIQHAYFVDVNSTEYKAGWNQLRNIPRVYAPQDKAVGPEF